MMEHMGDDELKRGARIVFCVRPATVVACALLLCSGLAFGGASKRAVGLGDAVPQEDALMEARAILAQDGGDSEGSEGRAAEDATAGAGVGVAVGGVEGEGATSAATATDDGNGVPAVEPVSDGDGGKDVVEGFGEGVSSVVPEVQNTLGNEDGGTGQIGRDNREYAAVKLVENGVWFNFAEGQSYLADGANAALGSIARIKPGQSLVIVTYLDPKLGVPENEALARDRAQGIQKVLLGLKISSERIVMLKPRAAQAEQTFAHAADWVEVRVEDGNDYSAEEVFTE